MTNIADKMTNIADNRPTPKIYVLMGFSGAGKDTLAAAINQVNGAVNVKFAAPGKRVLEYMYGLEEGFLDDREKRLQIAPYSDGKTYLEVLIDFLKHRDKVVGAKLFPYKTREVICSTLETLDVCITDMRDIVELEALTTIDAELVTVWICGGMELESDVQQLKLFGRLETWSSVHAVIDNTDYQLDMAKAAKDLAVLSR